jgi:hypothetical protein
MKLPFNNDDDMIIIFGVTVFVTTLAYAAVWTLS